VIIDVDAHGEPPEHVTTRAWQEAGLPPLDVAETTMRFVAGDLLATIPRNQWPSMEDLLPPGAAAIAGVERVEGFAYEGAQQDGIADPGVRLAWLDANEIDAQNVIALRGLTATRFLDDRAAARDVISACNTYMGEAHEEVSDRLWPTTALTFEDLDWVVRELTRMRQLGSRSFLISAVPTNGIPHFHSAFDRVWAAAIDLGMLPILHVGANPALFAEGWGNVEGNMMLLRQLGVCQPHQQIQVFLNGMVFGGVFERHPELTVLIAECGIHWFESTVEHMEQRDASQHVSPRLFMGEYPWSSSPAEFVRQNVRITPLPTDMQDPAPLLERFPECVVFSSDYAHNEGHPSPVAHYDRLLAHLPESTRRAFFGGSMREVFTRMGHPIEGLSVGRGA
jgi:predicted TIM-barrel fold metal-dependent hydrolase